MSQSRSLHADTPNHTPGGYRPNIAMHGHFQSPMNQSNFVSPQMIYETNSMMSEDAGVIFGTNVSTTKVMNQLENFILNFEVMEGEQQKKIYRSLLTDIGLDLCDTFHVQGVHIKEYDQELYYQLIYFPAQVIWCFDAVLKNLFTRHFIDEKSNDLNPEQMEKNRSKCSKLMVGITHLDDEEINIMRNLTPKQINRLVSFKGIVIRCSQIYPEMKAAVFKCTSCNHETQVELQNARVQEPTGCSRCKIKHNLEIVHNLCSFTDKQYIKFQEQPENVPEGETPSSITILAYDANVDGMRPGDRVQIIGIYRAQGQKLKRNQNTLKAVFNTYVDLISFTVIEEERYKASTGDSNIAFSDDEKKTFYEMADRENIIEDLVDSFAPSIFGHQEIKKGILAQLFGGAKKKFEESGRGHFRSDINICLVGDPSTAKSQLLQQVYKIAPRGIYTSGRGSSAVGLTANVRKDPQTHQFILESGALVLSDLGICCIDQFDKMDDNSKTILLQAMEQQTISVAKAGIVCQLNSRTAILAAANPINSKYDLKKSVVENINLNPALLSRFDLIYLVLDRPQKQQDKRLASHILNIYSNKEVNTNRIGFFPKDLLAKYITYARQYVTPIISESAGKRLSSTYLEMRKMGSSKKTITATPRQLQSLIRISEAFAKMRLSLEVSENDVERAIQLIKVATQQAATDPESGLIDMDSILIGRTQKSKDRVMKIKQSILEFMKGNQSYFKKAASIQALAPEIEKLWEKKDEPVIDNELIEALKILETESKVIMYGNNKRPTFKFIGNVDPL